MLPLIALVRTYKVWRLDGWLAGRPGPFLRDLGLQAVWTAD
ncbi:MAG TPA: hypothetical protein VF055_00875 [Steroidobacteraceae bacterium]